MKVLLVLMISFLLGGCAQTAPVPNSPDPAPVIVRVEIRCQPRNKALERVYTSQDKMIAVLEYLRNVDGRSLYDHSVPAGPYKKMIITTVNSQGKEQIYCQYGADYLQRPGDRLYLLYPEQGDKLRSILLENTSDRA